MAFVVSNFKQYLIGLDVSIFTNTKEEDLVDIALNNISKMINLNIWLSGKNLFTEHQSPFINLFEEQLVDGSMLNLDSNIFPFFVKLTAIDRFSS